MSRIRTLAKICVYGAVLGACALGTSIALAAWSAPLNGPPTCTSGNPGCDAPLNIGPTAQTKSGSLTISGSGSSITSPQYCIGSSCITTWPSSGGGGSLSGGALTYIPEWSGSNSLTNSTMYYNGSALALPGPAGNWALEVAWPPAGSNYGILVGTGANEYSQFQNAQGYYTQVDNGGWGIYSNGSIYEAGNVESGADIYDGASGIWLSRALYSGGGTYTTQNSGYFTGGGQTASCSSGGFMYAVGVAINYISGSVSYGTITAYCEF